MEMKSTSIRSTAKIAISPRLEVSDMMDTCRMVLPSVNRASMIWAMGLSDQCIEALI